MFLYSLFLCKKTCIRKDRTEETVKYVKTALFGRCCDVNMITQRSTNVVLMSSWLEEVFSTYSFRFSRGWVDSGWVEIPRVI